jgi:hypothetical protein
MLARLFILTVLLIAAVADVAQGTPAETRAIDLIDAARGPCKLEPPRSSGVSEYDSGFGGVREVSATVVRKGVGGSTTSEVATARWEIRDANLKPLDPMAGEINRRCREDPGKPNTPSEWRSLPYFGGHDQAFLYLITSKRWDGAKQVTKHLPNTTGSQDWGEAGGYIWRRECDPGRDSVRLQRTIFLPGRPFGGADIRAGVNTLGGVFGPRARPVTEVDVLLNGQRILRVKKRGDAFDFDEVPARLFRHGANRVVIEAKKRRTGKCNKGRSSALVGVEFSLYATYGSDLAVEVPAHGQNSAFGIDVPFTVVNEGPSDIPEAVLAFSFTIHTTGGKAVLQRSGAGDCEPEPPYLIEPPTFGILFVCRVRNIERGESKSFTWRVIPGLPEGETYWSGTLSWLSRISGMGEVDGSNQNGGRTITGCFQGDPRCAQAGTSVRPAF